MRFLTCLMILGLAVSAGTLSMAADGKTSIQWISSPADGSAQASREQKPLLLYFTTSWCGYCKKLEQTTWTNADVAAEINAKFIPVKVDGDKHRDLVKSLKIKGFPTIVVVTPDGREQDRLVGYATAPAMLTKLTTARSKVPATAIQPVSFR